MKVAIATDDLLRVDAHFGTAKHIAIYEVSPTEWSLTDVVDFAENLLEDGSEDKLGPKVGAIKECTLLYVAAIGGSAAARVVAQKVHPIKLIEPEEIPAVLGKLQKVLAGTPPLRKALRADEERSLDFMQE